jgi:hypothetical protein
VPSPSPLASRSLGAPQTRARRRFTLLLVGGFALLQIGWLFALPPVRGMDEFDHIYRATSVAAGDWYAAPTDATRGTGAHVTVRNDILEATKGECRELSYTTEADCWGEAASEDRRTVGSGAGRYNPAFYAVAGLPSLWLEGTAAVYGMRVVSMLICLVLLWATVSAAQTLGSRSFMVGLALAITPAFAHASVVIAPNATEIAAGLLLWVSLLAVFRADSTPTGAMLLRIFIAGSILVTVRSLGPLWCLLILCVAILTAERPIARFRTVVRSRAAQLTLLGVVLATIASCAWVLLNRSLKLSTIPDPHISLAERLDYTVGQLPLWLFQTVGAFPYRGSAAHPAVYGAFFACLGGLLGLSLLRGDRRLRLLMLLVVAISAIVPITIVWVTLGDFGDVWQGRYLLPFSVGVPLLAGLALAGRTPVRLRAAGIGVLVGCVYALAHTAGPVDLQRDELGTSPGVDNGSWILVSPWLVACLCAAGAFLMWWAAWNSRAVADHGGQREPLEDGRVAPPPELTPSRGRGVGE